MNSLEGSIHESTFVWNSELGQVTCIPLRNPCIVPFNKTLPLIQKSTGAYHQLSPRGDLFCLITTKYLNLRSEVSLDKFPWLTSTKIDTKQLIGLFRQNSAMHAGNSSRPSLSANWRGNTSYRPVWMKTGFTSQYNHRNRSSRMP